MRGQRTRSSVWWERTERRRSGVECARIYCVRDRARYDTFWREVLTVIKVARFPMDMAAKACMVSGAEADELPDDGDFIELQPVLVQHNTTPFNNTCMVSGAEADELPADGDFIVLQPVLVQHNTTPFNAAIVDLDLIESVIPEIAVEQQHTVKLCRPEQLVDVPSLSEVTTYPDANSTIFMAESDDDFPHLLEGTAWLSAVQLADALTGSPLNAEAAAASQDSQDTAAVAGPRRSARLLRTAVARASPCPPSPPPAKKSRRSLARKSTPAAAATRRSAVSSGKKSDECDLNCPSCNFTGKDREGLQRHMRAHRDRTKMCPEPGCNFVTSYQTSLPRHMNTHIKDKEDVRMKACDYDGCSFYNARQDKINTHIKRLHKNFPYRTCGMNIYKNKFSACKFVCCTLERMVMHQVTKHREIERD